MNELISELIVQVIMIALTAGVLFFAWNFFVLPAFSAPFLNYYQCAAIMGIAACFKAL